MTNLARTKKEDDELVLECLDHSVAIPEYELSLLEKLLTNRTINYGAMRNIMASLWHSGRGISIKEMQLNLFLFHFFHPINLCVLDGALVV